MTNNEFKEIFNDNFTLLSKEELEVIIEQELEKSESEMDADLIEYCLDILNELELKTNISKIAVEEGDTNGSVKKTWCFKISHCSFNFDFYACRNTYRICHYI